MDAPDGRPDADADADDGDLTDLLGELRVLLPSAQLLSAFLITVPFTAGFANVVAGEKDIFLATFLLSVASMVLLSAPAVQHRLLRPLPDRARFKRFANRQIVAGATALALALVLGTQFVLANVLGDVVANAVAVLVGAMIVLLWWILPTAMKARGKL